MKKVKWGMGPRYRPDGTDWALRIDGEHVGVVCSYTQGTGEVHSLKVGDETIVPHTSMKDAAKHLLRQCGVEVK